MTMAVAVVARMICLVMIEVEKAVETTIEVAMIAVAVADDVGAGVANHINCHECLAVPSR